jgi:putative DNA primase/helicase
LGAVGAGSDYLQRATEAALKLSITNDSSVSIGTELLQSIRLIFEDQAILKISSAALVDELMSREDQPWATYNKGWPMSPRQIAQLLKQYGIKPKTIRIREGCTPKGYSSDQFDDAFARYLSVDKLIIESNGEISQEQPAVELSGLERMILDDRKYRDVVTESSVTELAEENSNGDFPYEEAF